ncbi:unnamed protein product [Adineta steineri]|uniref:Uncharacterized protein n=1 Tax=Adineta steineri TaxID=433720 RepID=A0A815P8P3_9BILA|nr:unnamed protein product [Adineta steineri]
MVTRPITYNVARDILYRVGCLISLRKTSDIETILSQDPVRTTISYGLNKCEGMVHNNLFILIQIRFISLLVKLLHYFVVLFHNQNITIADHSVRMYT